MELRIFTSSKFFLPAWTTPSTASITLFPLTALNKFSNEVASKVPKSVEDYVLLCCLFHFQVL